MNDKQLKRLAKLIEHYAAQQAQQALDEWQEQDEGDVETLTKKLHVDLAIEKYSDDEEFEETDLFLHLNKLICQEIRAAVTRVRKEMK